LCVFFKSIEHSNDPTRHAEFNSTKVFFNN